MNDILPCPGCGSLLRRAAAMTPGTAIRCPRCDAVFTAPGPDGAAPAGITAHPGDAPPPRVATFDAAGISDRPFAPLEPTFGPHWRVDLGHWLNIAWRHWGRVVWPFLGFYLVCGLLLGPLFVGAALLPQFALNDFAGLGGGGANNIERFRTFALINALAVNPLLGLLAQLMLTGSLGVAIRQLTGRPWAFSDFFHGFHKAGPLAGWWLLNQAVGLVAGGPLLLVMFVVTPPLGPIPTQAWLAQLVGAYTFWLAAMLVYLYFAIRWSFTLCLIFDRDLPLFDAMGTSWRMTRGHFWGLFGANFVLGLLALCGYMACVVGLLFAGSFVTLAHATAYLDATSGRYRPRGEED